MRAFGLGLISYATVLCIFGCERSTIIQEEIEYIDKIPEPCVSKPAPIYHPGEMVYGRISGLKNCLPFMASAESLFYYHDGYWQTGLDIRTFEDWGNFFANKEFIVVGATTLTKGTFSMYNQNTESYIASYSTVQDHDVAEDIFRIDPSYSHNEITFSDLDTVTGHIQGSFECRFILASNIPSGNNPDTILFTECHFDARER